MEWNERNLAIFYFLLVFVIFFILALVIGAVIFILQFNGIPTNLTVTWLIVSLITALLAGLSFSLLRVIILSMFKKKAPYANKPK